MARTKQGNLSKTEIKNTLIGEPGRRKFYSDGLNGLILSVDRRSGEPIYAFYFEGKLNGRTLRYKIGNYSLYGNSAYSIERARKMAVEATLSIDRGVDPRAVKLANINQSEVERQVKIAGNVVLSEVWDAYLQSRQRDIRPLSQLTVRDYRKHINKAFLDWSSQPIRQISRELISEFYPSLVARIGTAQANQAIRSLSAVLNWTIESRLYPKALVENPVAVLKKKMHKVKPRENSLEKSQLTSWWTACEKIENETAKAYLKILLFTGARREELLSLRWKDVDLRWEICTFFDTKNNDDRTIPLSKYVAEIIRGLPKINEFVFSSATSVSGAFREPAKFIMQIADETGLHISSHDLRRSFATLSEWAELPDGAIKQIIGHKPSGVTEAHYKRRPVDLLRSMLQRYENFILSEIKTENNTSNI